MMSGCQQPIDMPICKHMRPVKFGCTECYAESFKPDFTEPNPVIYVLSQRMEILESRHNFLENSLKIAQQDLARAYSRIKDLEDSACTIMDVVEKLVDRIEKLERDYQIERKRERISQLEMRLSDLDHIIKAANHAETLFAQKVHDLKSIDQKRDDVINALCQKIETLDQWRINLIERGFTYANTR